MGECLSRGREWRRCLQSLALLLRSVGELKKPAILLPSTCLPFWLACCCAAPSLLLQLWRRRPRSPAGKTHEPELLPQMFFFLPSKVVPAETKDLLLSLSLSLS